MASKTTTWVGIKPCGCVVSGVSSRDRDALVEGIGEMVLAGLRVEERPTLEVSLRACQCEVAAITNDIGGEG